MKRKSGVAATCVDPQAMPTMMAEEKNAKWFVDAYRLLRNDDEYAFQSELVGLYDVEGNFGICSFGIEKASVIVKDFIVFIKLAVECGEIKAKPDDKKFWSELQDAGCDLQYGYEKCDCIKDYGEFTPMLMRMSAEKIYGWSLMSPDNQERAEEIRNVEERVDNVFAPIDEDIECGKRITWNRSKSFWNRGSVADLLEDIGGAIIYEKIAENLAKAFNDRWFVLQFTNHF